MRASVLIRRTFVLAAVVLSWAPGTSLAQLRVGISPVGGNAKYPLVMNGLRPILISDLSQTGQFKVSEIQTQPDQLTIRNLGMFAPASAVDAVLMIHFTEAAPRFTVTVRGYDAQSGFNLGSRSIQASYHESRILQDQLLEAATEILRSPLAPQMKAALAQSHTDKVGAIQALGEADVALREKRYVDVFEGYARSRAIDPKFRAPNERMEAEGKNLIGRLADPTDVGRAYAFTGDAEKSRAAFEQALTKNPNNVNALVGQGDLLVQLNRPAEALGRYERAIALNPKSASAAVGLARTYQQLGRGREAQLAYEKAKELGSTDPDVFEKLGTIYVAGRNTKSAVDAYQTAGELSERSADFNKAQKYYAEANRLAPTAMSIEREADLYVAAGEIQVAITLYTKALFVDANRDSLWSKLAYAYYLNQQPSEALKRFRKAYDLNPSNYEANLYLGILLLSDRQQRTQAVKYLETAARLRPEESETQFYLARAYLADGRNEAAVSVLEKLIRLLPRSPQAHKELGDAYLGAANALSAEAEYNRAIDLMPDYREAREALAKLYLKSGRRKEAIEEIERVYAIDAVHNVFVTEGSDLLGSIVPIELITLVRRFPKSVPSGVGMSPINQVGVLRLEEAGGTPLARIYNRFFSFYRLSASRITEDFEVALLVQYLSISPSILSKNIPTTITPADFASDSFLLTGLTSTRLDGFFGVFLSSVQRRGAATEVTVQPRLFSGVDRTRYPAASGEPIQTTVTYPTDQVLRFNPFAVANWLLLLGILLGPLAGFSVSRSRTIGKGNLRVTINYDPKLESFLTLKLSKKQEQGKDSSRILVRDKEKYERQKYKALLRQTGAWVRRMVGRDTLFERVPARSYYCYLYGTIEDKMYLKKTVGNYYMVQRVQIRKNETAEIVFQLEKEEAFCTVFVTKGEQEISGAEIRVEGQPEPTFSRGSAGAFIYLKPGRHKLKVTHEKRTVEHRVDALNLDDKIITIDLQTAEEAEAVAVGDRSLGQAADEFKQQGKLQEAAKLYDKAGQSGAAQSARAEALLSEGNTEGAAAEFAKARDFFRAAETFRQAGKLDKSDYFYGLHAYQQEDFPKALQYLENSGQHTLLAKIHEKLGDPKSALIETAKAHIEKGQKLEAAQVYLQAESFADAADLYESLGDLAKAAVLHARDGNYALAGELFARTGDPKRAAMAFEKGGHLEQAVAIYRDLNEPQKMVELLERQEQFVEAAQVYKDQGMLDEAIAMCQKVPSHHQEFGRTRLMLANMFAEKGLDDLAVRTFEEAMVSHAGAMDNDSMYAYASLLEKKGDYAKALGLLEDILKKDFHHKDVNLKVEELKGKASAQSAMNVSETVNAGAPRKDTRYEILEEVGRGAMGVVYKARDRMLDRVVAYKTLPHTLRDDPAALESLMREAQTAAKLNHPNIVTVFDVGQEEGVCFMAMEYVEGKTLQQVLKQVKRVNVQSFLHVAKSLCDVVAYAHENRVIHRDIKPSNIILLSNRTVKLMDFGLAKVLRDLSIDKTMLRGTPLYMSPEQVLGKDIDHRTDIYSLGVLFFEMLTGGPPFFQGDIMYAHLHTPPPSIQEALPDLPNAVAQTVMACLSKDKAQRPKSGRQLAHDLGL